MLKGIGLTLFAMAPMAAGVWHAVGLTRRYRLLRGLLAFARAVQVGVTEHAWDQREIYRRFSDRCLEERGFLARLEEEVRARPWGALSRTAADFFEKEDPGTEAKEAFLSFAQCFGTVGLEEQTKFCLHLTATLEDLAEREKKDLWNRIRLALAAGCAAGCGILILFW